MAAIHNAFAHCRKTLLGRLRETAPGRIQLLTGPRQVGKTTLLLEIAKQFGKRGVYAAGDDPDAALPGFWDSQQMGRNVHMEGREYHLRKWQTPLPRRGCSPVST